MRTNESSIVTFLPLVIAIFTGCMNTHRQNIGEIVKEWQGKKIQFPDEIVYTKYGIDTLDYHFPRAGQKIVTYVDSTGCTSCKLRLQEWRYFIQQVDSITFGKVPVLFVFHPKSVRDIRILLRRERIEVPVWIDLEDEWNRMNQFPDREEFHTFLLDKDNRVVCIGNPIHNEKVKELYLSILDPKSNSSKQIGDTALTQVELASTSFDLGQMKLGESKEVKIPIKNIGSVPLKLTGFDVSCGCTNVQYDKSPTPSDSTNIVILTYHADEPGSFSKTVSIYGNINPSPLVLTLTGNIILP